MAAITSLFVWLAACMPVPPQVSPTATAPPVRLKAVVLPYTSSGPLFIAQEEGFFAQQGLAVEFVRLDTGGGPLAALEQGEVDIAASGPTVGFLNAVARGGRIRVVADKGNFDPAGCTYMALLARPDWIATNPLAAPAAMTGLRVSIDPTNFEAFMLDQLLAGSGLSLHDLNVADVAPPALAEAVKNHAVDLISVGDPWVTRLLDTGLVAVWRPAQEIAPRLQFGVLLYGKNMLAGDPEIGVRFMTAYLRGVRQYNAGKTEHNIEIMAKHTNLDPALLRRACWPAMAEDGAVNIASILAFQDWASKQGLVDRAATAAQILDTTYAAQAQQRLGAPAK
jgi:NitT/TauT family transport system substrate-binding protein